MTKQELATKIWATANELRKNIKASEYKDYILGFMFYKYLCDKEIDYLKSLGGDVEDLKDVDEGDKNKFKDGIGYFISHKNLFLEWKNLGTNLGAKDVSEAINDFYLNLNGRYKTVFDKVFSALQSGLSKLGENSGSRDKAVRDIVDLVDLIPPTSRDFDVLGYIYEYLIQQFSSEAKKDGSFYTPHEVTSMMSRILAYRLKDRKEIMVYDPTVGSGGLLLNIGKEVGRYVSTDNIRYYGQELITETANLAKMNLFMQGVPVQNINMRNANTLEEDWPYFDEQTAYSPLFVDAVVSNPPYSAHYNPDEHRTDERFKGYGLAPKTKADYAFLLHCLYHIKKDGIMAIVLPHGVLFRGASEGEIRKNLILNHNIETIIGLPQQLFFATSIPVIVMILSKGRSESDILFVDASKSFKKDKKQNVLTESDVQKIFDTVIARKDVEGFAHLASLDEIKANDYNLNIPRYVESDTDDMSYDIYSLMTGEVSDRELERFKAVWKQFPSLKKSLIDSKKEYSVFKDVECKSVVYKNSEVKLYIKNFNDASEDFKTYLKKCLIEEKGTPEIYYEIIDKLFENYKDQPLIDIYKVFQALVDEWNIIDSDLARLEAEGWKICSQIEPNMVTKKDSKTNKTIEEQKGWKGKVIPLDIVKKQFFATDLNEISVLTSQVESKSSECDEIWEGFDEEVKSAVCKENDDASYDPKKIKAGIKSGDYDDAVINDFKRILKIIDEEKEINKNIKSIVKELDDKTCRKIEELTEEDVKKLLEIKWIDPLINSINGMCKAVIDQFINDFTAIQKKYSNPLAEISEEIAFSSNELKESLGQLTGSDFDMKAIEMLIKDL